MAFRTNTALQECKGKSQTTIDQTDVEQIPSLTKLFKIKTTHYTQYGKGTVGLIHFLAESHDCTPEKH